MKSKKQIAVLRIMVAAVLSALFMQGCTKEDNTNCGIAVSFKYDKNVDGVNKFGSTVSRIDLYIFDASGKYLGTESVQANQLPENELYFPTDYVMRLLYIQPGIYTLVAWCNRGNVLSNSTLSRDAASDFSTSTLSLNVEGGISPRTENMTLFHGAVQQLVVEGGVQGTKNVLIDLTKFTNHIEVSQIGLPVGDAPVDNLPFKCYITSKNGSYNFDGTYADDKVVTYNPYPVSVEGFGSTIVSNFTILRELNEINGVKNPTESHLIVSLNPETDDPDDILVDESLVDILTKAAGTPRNPKNTGNLDIDDEFKIEIEFKYTGTDVTVFINDWEYSTKPIPPLK